MTSTMAVAFCDVVSSTEVRARLGDAVADRWFADLLRRIGDAVTDANGTVVKSLGDGVMAVFTSAGAAVNAAVGMQQAAAAHGHANPLERAHLRVGASMGDVSSADDDWFGMPVVEAARLCAAAGTGEILIADVVRVLAGNRSIHRITPAGEFTLKGLPEPLAAARVEWEPPAPTDAVAEFSAPLAAARRGPFVGRLNVVAELHDTWKAGDWHGLLVSGEPGIGKTRLVAELAHGLHDSGVTVLLGRCDQDLAVGYRPWSEALTTLVGIAPIDALEALAPEHAGELGRLVPALQRRLPTAPIGIELDAATRQALLGDAIVSLLGGAAPVAIVLDDLHWADQPSLVVMRHVLAAAHPDVTVVGTYRDTDLDRVHPLSAALSDLRRLDGIRRLALDGLDDAAVADFLTAAAGHELGADGENLAHAVHARTAGNPLFVGEMLRHLAESGAISRTDDRWVGTDTALALPEGLREVIGRRLTTLGDDVTQSLRIAAIVGRDFDLDVVEQVLGRDPLDDIERAAAAGIVIESGSQYEFRHAVLREVLLAELSAARRQRLHRDLVAVLERRWATNVEQHLDELAFHHGEARTPEAPSWYHRAAEAALASFDRRSVELADRGLELLDLAAEPDSVLACDLLVVRAMGLARVNADDSLDAAQTAFDAAVQIGDRTRMARALYGAGMTVTSSDDASHVDFVRGALVYFADDTSLSRWSAEALLLEKELITPRLAPDEHLRRAHEILGNLDPSEPAACQLAMSFAIGLTFMNRPAEALGAIDRFAKGAGGTFGNGLPIDRVIAHARLAAGDRAGFDTALDGALNMAVTRRTVWMYEAQVVQNEGMRLMLEGRWVEANDAIERVQHVAGHQMNFVLGCMSQRSWLGRETGKVEQQYIASLKLRQAMPHFPVLGANLVADAAEAGHFDEAALLLDELAPNDFAAVGRGWLTVLALGGVAWATVTVDATAHAEPLRRLLADYSGQFATIASGTHVMCAVDRLLAGLAAVDGDHVEADRLFAGALALEESARSLPLATRTRHWWGRALIRRGEPDRATPLLTQASADAEHLAMTAVVQQINRLLA
jgi:class 3 adenylate cyclase